MTGKKNVPREPRKFVFSGQIRAKPQNWHISRIITIIEWLKTTTKIFKKRNQGLVKTQISNCVWIWKELWRTKCLQTSTWWSNVVNKLVPKIQQLSKQLKREITVRIGFLTDTLLAVIETKLYFIDKSRGFFVFSVSHRQINRLFSCESVSDLVYSDDRRSQCH